MNFLSIAAGLCGFLAVALGAFGAHGLEGKLSTEAEGWWATATLSGLVHSVAALAIALSQLSEPYRAGWAFILGILIFSGSLYAMALGAPRWFGMITPIGGLFFLAGWALVVIAAARKA